MKVIKLNRKWEEDYLNLHVRVLVVKLTIYNFFKPTESQHIESSDDDDLLTIDEAEEGEINENVDNLLTDNEFLSNLNKSGKRLIWKGCAVHAKTCPEIAENDMMARIGIDYRIFIPLPKFPPVAIAIIPNNKGSDTVDDIEKLHRKLIEEIAPQLHLHILSIAEFQAQQSDS
ncbi:unnamed protein product [Rhizophagus irregularis]|uniref:Uncharacterized protein n=1 Tax=Rhizophagus irregularis TaxID=588596 RepID=A0A915YPE8_9GLOM|nr:unnamed protein product [Rhizophagus irregularis]